MSIFMKSKESEKSEKSEEVYCIEAFDNIYLLPKPIKIDTDMTWQTVLNKIILEMCCEKITKEEQEIKIKELKEKYYGESFDEKN